VQGPEYAVDRYNAVHLSTVAGAELNGESSLKGSLQPAKFADIVAFGEYPLTCSVDRLPDLQPRFTLVGGQPVYDPDLIVTK